MRHHVILNPTSGGGLGGRLRREIERELTARGLPFTLSETERPWHAVELAQAAAKGGAEVVVAAGGDGTIHEVANGLLRASAAHRPALGVIPVGTGNDFAKNLPAPAADHGAMAALVAHGTREQRVDLGRVDDQWFLNVAGFGFDVAVNVATADREGWLRGGAVYVIAAPRLLVQYRGFHVHADVFGDHAPMSRMMLVISNGKNFGGAFLIAPAAQVNDGMLDFVSVGDVHGAARVPLFARALRGAHLTHPSVQAVRAPGATLTFESPPMYEIDGDLYQAASNVVRIGMAPNALRVLVG